MSSEDVSARNPSRIPGEVKTFVLAYGEYMGVFPDMSEFVGTWHELLLSLLGVDDQTWKEYFVQAPSDEELVALFDMSNGDGQHFIQVWCVEDRKQVLGGHVHAST